MYSIILVMSVKLVLWITVSCVQAVLTLSCSGCVRLLGYKIYISFVEIIIKQRGSQTGVALPMQKIVLRVGGQL